MKRQDTLKLFAGQVRRKLSTLLSLFVLVPVLLAACVSALPKEEQPEAVAPAVEEVQVTSEEEPVSDTPNLAENPELMVAGRYSASVIDNEETSGSTFFAANPELSVAGRYEPPTRDDEVASDSTTFANNPELVVAGRYHREHSLTESDILAENPELKVVRQYEAALKK